MKPLLMGGIIMLLLMGVSSAEEPPDWAKHDYSAPVDEVYAAAMQVILFQHFHVTGKAGSTFWEFHIGKSPGYDVRLTVTRIDDKHSHVAVERLCPGDKTCSLNPVRKEVRKIIDGIDAELRGKTPGAS
ncbi:MAG TPA: hypothetical protein VEI26_04155 [Terriglobales bacterium]|nr:hypothetical protein [Terriglobales bacterium]